MRNQPMTIGDICHAMRKTPDFTDKKIAVKDSKGSDGSHDYVPVINAEYDEDFDMLVLTTPLSYMDKPSIRYTGNGISVDKSACLTELFRSRECLALSLLLSQISLRSLRFRALVCGTPAVLIRAGELQQEGLSIGDKEIQRIRDRLIKALGFNPEAVKNTLKED